MVLDYAQSHPAKLKPVLRCILLAVRERLEGVQISYPVPNRTSLEETAKLLGVFLSERAGGLRLQAVSVALFQTLGECLALFCSVDSRHVNAADSRTGNAADLECKAKDGSVVMAVEVKDRQLKIIDLQDRLPSIRERGIKEALYLVTGGIARKDEREISETARREFARGHNIYVCDFEPFLRSCLVLLGENGRRSFLQLVGKELDRAAELRHRQSWRDLLRAT